MVKMSPLQGSRIEIVHTRYEGAIIGICELDGSAYPISINATAMPLPGFTFLTMARARTSPPGTSKTIFNRVPMPGGSGVEINSPPSPTVATRDTDRPPACCHATSMPFGSATRGYLRFTACDAWLIDTCSRPCARVILNTTSSLRERTAAKHLSHWPFVLSRYPHALPGAEAISHTALSLWDFTRLREVRSSLLGLCLCRGAWHSESAPPRNGGRAYA